MSSSTVNRPAVEVERIPMARVYALILAEARRSWLHVPMEIRQNGPGSSLLCLRFATHADLYAWCPFFGAAVPAEAPRLNPDGERTHQAAAAYLHRGGWMGWSVTMESSELAEMDAETAALIDEVTAGPAADISAACTCGGGVVHQLGCAAGTAPTWTCPPCTVPGHFTAPDHTFAEGCRYERGVFAGSAAAVLRCFWRGCDEPQDGPSAYCVEHDAGEGAAARHAVQVRRELVEALAAGPSVLSTYSRTAIEAALADGVLVEQGPDATGRMVYALSEDPETSAHEHLMVVTGRAHVAEMYGEPSRVDPDAAAQIPVVVVEVAQRTSGAFVMHYRAGDTAYACGREFPGRIMESSTYLADAVTCPECRALLTLPTRTPGAALVDEPAPELDRLIESLTATRITAEDVAGHLAADWHGLTSVQQVRLVELAGLAGWSGDWRACLAQVLSDPDLATVADDARLIVSELADLPDVSLAQLAQVRAEVAADETIAYVLAHRGEAVPVVDVVTVDPELDAGRGGAEIAHLTGASS